ncbi:magnesium ion transporter [Ceratobasidium sp. 370]|nr:magnesium ion transporter [Ceratobasidium sp. 370]
MLPALARRLAGCRRTRAALGPLVSVEALASAEARASHPRPLNVWAHHGLSDGDDEAARSAILENALKGRQPTDLMLRCTVLDAEGNVKRVSGQFTKSDLCAEHRLNPRDLRKIDSRIPNLVPTILTRKEAILVNILHIRALVKADAVILFDSYGSVDSRLHSVFLYHLEHNLKQKTTSLPYEFRALESILVSVVSALEAEMVFTRHLVGGLLAELEDDIDRDKFKHEDLNSMYLTDAKLGLERNMQDHEDLEILLESFDKQVEEIVNEAETTISNVQSTQEIVELILDSNRNALLALDLKVSIGTFGIGVGALVAGLFGMNVRTASYPKVLSRLTRPYTPIPWL